MSMIAYWKIRARLLRVPGVANVAIWGERLQMLQVQVEPEQDAARTASRLEQVMDGRPPTRSTPGCCSTRDGAVIGTGGFIDTPQPAARHPARAADRRPRRTSAEVADRGARTAKPLRLGDVADVVEDHQPLIGDAVINERRRASCSSSRSCPWGNTLEVTEGVEAALDELRAGPAAASRSTPTIFRPATFIEDSHRATSRSALLLGFLLVVIVLGAVPLRVAHRAHQRASRSRCRSSAALLVLYLTGTTINTMILAGLVIAVGVVVDDAIIDIENIVRRLRQQRARRRASVHGDGRSSRPRSRCVAPIVYATLIHHRRRGADLLPRGPHRRVLPAARDWPTPSPCSRRWSSRSRSRRRSRLILLRKAPLEPRDPPLVRVLKRGYKKSLEPDRRPSVARVRGLRRAHRRRRGHGCRSLGQSLLPDFKERDFLMHWVTQARHLGRGGGPHHASRPARSCSTIAGVRNFGAHIGQALHRRRGRTA